MSENHIAEKLRRTLSEMAEEEKDRRSSPDLSKEAYREAGERIIALYVAHQMVKEFFE